MTEEYLLPIVSKIPEVFRVLTSVTRKRHRRSFESRMKIVLYLGRPNVKVNEWIRYQKKRKNDILV